jgi:hypothetical protein
MKGPAIALGALAGLGLLAACFGLVFVEPVVTMAAAATPATAPGQPQPSGLPVVSGPAQPGNPLGPDCPHPPVSQPFGPSTLQLEPAAHGYAHFHTGIDLACPYGTLIRNVDVVGLAHVTSGCSGYGTCGGGFGNNVVVEATTPAGHFFIRYGHLAATAASVLYAIRKFRVDLAQDPCAMAALEFLRRRLEERQHREKSLLLQLPALQQAPMASSRPAAGRWVVPTRPSTRSTAG